MPDSCCDKDLVFVVSGGRTGTQFFGDQLSSIIEGCFSVHDPDILSVFRERIMSRVRTFGFRHMVTDRVLQKSGLRVIGQKLITGRIDEREALQRLHQMRDHYYNSIPQSLIAESNSQWLYVVDQLARLWPHARVVVVIRDPRSWIRSWMNKGYHQRPYDPVKLIPPGRLRPADVGDEQWVSQWKRFDTFGRLAWEWRFVYGRLYRHMQTNPNCRFFRFEDVFNREDTSAMFDLVQFSASHDAKNYPFRIPSGFSGRVQNASAGNSPEWRDWDSAQARLVHQLCGGLMRRFQYGLEDEWKQKLD